MSALVNLNARSFPDEPSGAITEADLLRAIAAGANSDADGFGWGDFSDTLPIPTLPFDEARPQPMPAEACTEIEADSPSRTTSPHGLAQLFTSYPRIATFALICFLLLCMGLADTNDLEAEHEQLANNAAEVQP